MQAPINAGVSTVLDGTGGGIVTFGPQTPGVSYTITSVATITSSTVNTPTFLLYQGPVGQQNFIGGTYDGNTDSSDVNVQLFNGQVMTGVWTGGDAGAQATMSVFGNKTSPGG